MPFFDTVKLSWPANGDINAWADFVETICMFSEDNRLSLEDFLDFLKDDASRMPGDLLSAINFNDQFLALPVVVAPPPPPIPMPAAPEADAEENEGDEDDFEGDDNGNEEREKLRSRLLVLFNFLQCRQNYFGDFYPFAVTNGTHIRQVGAFTPIQRIYVVLMLSSEMHLYKAASRNRIGHLFEALCRIPFTKLLPAIAEAKYFGAGGGNIIKADYNGNLHDRLVALAMDINTTTTKAIEDPDELGPTGDAGLDWVGWVSFGDNCDHQPIYFGQCACGANWAEKQHETALSVWQNLIVLNQSVQCFHFMPRSFRRTSLAWVRKTDIIQELILVDRYRLLKLFHNCEEVELVGVLSTYEELLNEAAAFEYERAR